MTDNRAFLVQGFRARINGAWPVVHEPKPESESESRFEHWVECGHPPMYCTRDRITDKITKEPLYK